MDIFAHTLWASALARAANKNKKLVEKNKGPLKIWWAGLWGVAPDLFAFGLPFLAMFYFMLTGQMDGFMWGHGHFGFPPGAEWIGDLPAKLYQISHSLVIFSAVFLIIWAIKKRPYYEMLGWALHILIDIPSHAGSFYPTPFLWPLSSWKFLHGVSWANPTYMVINYSALAAVYIFILITWLRKRKNKIL